MLMDPTDLWDLGGYGDGEKDSCSHFEMILENSSLTVSNREGMCNVKSIILLESCNKVPQ